MRGDETNNGKTPGKITPLVVRRKSGESREEPDILSDDGSLGELLIHMRRVREAIPVNERLREELRARLTEVQAQSCTSHYQSTTVTNGKGILSSFFQKSGRPRFLWLLPAVILIAVLYWVWWSIAAPKVLEAGPTKEISRFWLEDSPLDFTCAPQSRGYLAVRDGALQLLDQYGGQTGTVKAPGGQFYLCPALSPDGSKLALVRRHETGEEEIVTATMPAVPLTADAAQLLETALAKAEVLLKVDGGKSLSGLDWSPDGLTLVYVLGEPQGKNEIYLLAKGKDAVLLGEGSHPAWSPDGSRLVVERTGDSGQPELWLTGTGSSGALRLTEGERPAWNARGYLAFIRQTTVERVLTYRPDGSPLFKVMQRQGEIRTINLGRRGDISSKQKDEHPLSGDRLLLAPDNKPGAEELNWLRRLELEGVKEPRTLLLEQTGNFQNLSFSPDGKTLLVVRRDGGTVALVQVGLRESLTKGGDR